MKKTIMTAALVACAAVVAAQTVTSVNIVGYNKVELGAGLQIIATSFDDGENTALSVYGDTLPADTIISTYLNGGGYAQSSYTVNFLGVGSWSGGGALVIGNGVGYWIDIPSGNYTNVISGEVILDDSITNSIASGLQLLSFPYPVAVTVGTAGFTPSVDDVVSTYANGVGYIQSVYTENFLGIGSWSGNGDLAIAIGQGFWYDSAGDGSWSWVVERPFDN